jgi:thiamine pyrophosphokinase
MKVLLVLAGEPPHESLLEWRAEDADFIIAVDGGMNALTHAGIQPDLLVGDFDSFDPTGSSSLSYEVVREEDQNSTDLEKALRHLPGNEPPDEVVLLGATGGRSDHFLTNLLVVSTLLEETKVALDATDEIICRATPACSVSLIGMGGQTVSLLPLTRCEGVTTKGLRWELADVPMGPGVLLGQSNEAVSEKVSVSLRAGNLFVITPKN